MAKARMLHKKISVSTQVNKLSLPARLLFTWMIPHTDDEGRLKGDPEFIKATVVPMTKWSFKTVRNYLEEIKNQRLIYYWEENKEWFIEFVKWNEHQQIRKDRFEESNLPSFNKGNNNLLTTKRQPEDNQEAPQSNISELNKIEVNQSEYNHNEPIAEKNSYKNIAGVINPKTFEPKSEGELAAKEAWDKLEPYNPLAFNSTYLKALQRGLPTNLFYQFVSEIKQDPSIENKGAVFNKKVADYFNQKEVEHDQ